jgi:hypothetical protein
MKMICLFLYLGLSAAYADTSSSATGQALVTLTVVKNLNITNQKDLSFGEASLNAPAQIIAPDSDRAAQFKITGEENTQYTIVLPQDDEVFMVVGAGESEDERIAIRNFTSFPAAGANGFLNENGSQTLGVGATRAEVSESQEPGNYQAVFTVTVIY